MTNPNFPTEPERHKPLGEPLPEVGNGPIVTLIGKLLFGGGIVTEIVGINRSWRGPELMELGIAMIGFGMTWWIMGVILKNVERQ